MASNAILMFVNGPNPWVNSLPQLLIFSALFDLNMRICFSWSFSRNAHCMLFPNAHMYCFLAHFWWKVLCFVLPMLLYSWVNTKVIHKVILSFTPYPLFQWYPQSKEILLSLNMKCWNPAFNAQGSRIVLIVVQVGAMKIYVATLDTLRKGKKNWSSFLSHIYYYASSL
jgi:hypothetical protein